MFAIAWQVQYSASVRTVILLVTTECRFSFVGCVSSCRVLEVFCFCDTCVISAIAQQVCPSAGVRCESFCI